MEEELPRFGEAGEREESTEDRETRAKRQPSATVTIGHKLAMPGVAGGTQGVVVSLVKTAVQRAEVVPLVTGVPM